MSLNYVIYLAILVGFVVAATFYLRRFRDSLVGYIILWTVYACVALLVAVELGRDMFDIFSLLCIGLFIGAVLLFAVSARYAWPRYKAFATLFGLCSIIGAVVGADAFLVEPHWYEVRRETISTDKVAKPIKIAVIADLQTDDVGEYEKSVLQQVASEKPDLVLFPGDYIQSDEKNYPEECRKLNTMLRTVGISAPLGRDPGRCGEPRLATYLRWFAN